MKGLNVATKRRTECYQLGRFLFFGGLAALVNILSRIMLNVVVSYEVAIIVAYVCGMTIAYLLNKLFVFTPSGRSVHVEYCRFTVVNLFAVGQVWLVSVGLALYVFPWMGITWHQETVAHVIGVSIPMVTSYFGHRHFSFAARRESAR
jgi:putative flippase GtrA